MVACRIMSATSDIRMHTSTQAIAKWETDAMAKFEDIVTRHTMRGKIGANMANGLDTAAHGAMADAAWMNHNMMAMNIKTRLNRQYPLIGII